MTAFKSLFRATGIARPPGRGEVCANYLFRGLTRCFAWATAGLLVWIVSVLLWSARPAIEDFGWGFLTSSEWSPQETAADAAPQFGILPPIVGTLYTSVIALTIAGFLGVAIAAFISQQFVPPAVETVLKNVVELLAAIPSVVYGLWGLTVVVPLLLGPAGWLHSHLSGIPLFSTRLSGVGVLPASIVLAIMVMPTVTAISREAMAAVPPRIRDAAYGLGATRWETILGVILPASSTGIFGALALAFGRALGETMALAMLIGNKNIISWSVFSPANTLAALMANKFPEAKGMEVSALMYAGLALLVITLSVNVCGAWVMARASRAWEGAAS